MSQLQISRLKLKRTSKSNALLRPWITGLHEEKVQLVLPTVLFQALLPEAVNDDVFLVDRVAKFVANQHTDTTTCQKKCWQGDKTHNLLQLQGSRPCRIKDTGKGTCVAYEDGPRVEK